MDPQSAAPAAPNVSVSALCAAAVLAAFISARPAPAQQLPAECASTSANAHEIVTNTKCLGLVANESCPACPGFNPEKLVLHAGPSTTINGVAKTGTAPFFAASGPGAVTDNMFGKINVLDALTGRCGTAATVAAETNTLNCGPLKYDLATQGVVVPNVCFEFNATTGEIGRALASTGNAIVNGDRKSVV